ncbi:putative ORFan [Tupanvirus deep ocean]|uniref:ORFan n=2 Tax=Tupanvirus TaxID=2094720 RepID=A0AC62A7Q5_9VIRU|nr:putative ORFan [Tupanvirus deep ocean]QKU33705.1 putative ORFan [Tupanvirus deep ocean]
MTNLKMLNFADDVVDELENVGLNKPLLDQAYKNSNYHVVIIDSNDKTIYDNRYDTDVSNYSGNPAYQCAILNKCIGEYDLKNGDVSTHYLAVYNGNNVIMVSEENKN